MQLQLCLHGTHQCLHRGVIELRHALERHARLHCIIIAPQTQMHASFSGDAACSLEMALLSNTTGARAASASTFRSDGRLMTQYSVPTANIFINE